MTEKSKSPGQEKEATARRAFLGQIGKAAVTAPAVALLLAASPQLALAQYGGRRRGGNGGNNGGGSSPGRGRGRGRGGGRGNH